MSTIQLLPDIQDTEPAHTQQRLTRYAILIDVGYLYATAGAVALGLNSRHEYRVDAERLIDALIEYADARLPGDLLRLYWYDAARDRVPTVDQRVVAQLPRVKLRLGNLNARGEQKGVDAQIRSDLETLARHRAITDAALLAGDEDMVPAVEAAQAFGVRVHLLGVEPEYGSNQAERLTWECDSTDMLSAEFVKPYLTALTPPTPAGKVPSPAQLFAGRTPALPASRMSGESVHYSSAPRWPRYGTPYTGPSRERMVEVGEHVAHTWIITRGRENISDLLPGPLLPVVIDKELLIAAEKELGHSLRGHEKARLWLRDGFWARVYREFGLTEATMASLAEASAPTPAGAPASTDASTSAGASGPAETAAMAGLPSDG